MVISEASVYQNPPPITQPWTAAMTGFVRCQRCKSSVTESRSRAHHRLMYSATSRSEEHTSELQSLAYLVCRLLLEKKKKAQINLEQAYHKTAQCEQLKAY